MTANGGASTVNSQVTRLTVDYMRAVFASLFVAFLVAGCALPMTASPLCSVISGGCVEAYSVTHRLVSGYTGPLFQLNNGTSTLDVGQTAGDQADLSTWSAFCSGVPSNCKYSKIYAQVGSANNLVPSVFNAPFGPNCSTGGALVCAAPFAIDTGTGLPILQTTAPQEYTIALDAAATGITGTGSASVSVGVNGQQVATQLYCCGIFGLAHVYNGVDTPGTDFMVVTGYGQNPPVGVMCTTSTSYCLGTDEELGGVGGDLTTTRMPNIVAIIVYDHSANKEYGYANNSPIYSGLSPSTTLDSGTRIHLGGGGDLSQPAPIIARDLWITNTAMSAADVAAATTKLIGAYLLAGSRRGVLR